MIILCMILCKVHMLMYSSYLSVCVCGSDVDKETRIQERDVITFRYEYVCVHSLCLYVYVGVVTVKACMYFCVCIPLYVWITVDQR